jgi:hypothetical protein
MKILEIKEKAKNLGIIPGKMNKTDLIRATQVKEGYTPCYGTVTNGCPHMKCCFRDDCLPKPKLAKVKV